MEPAQILFFFGSRLLIEGAIQTSPPTHIALIVVRLNNFLGLLRSLCKPGGKLILLSRGLILCTTHPRKNRFFLRFLLRFCLGFTLIELSKEVSTGFGIG